MIEIVIVTKIHQRTQILMMAHHQNLQMRKRPKHTSSKFSTKSSAKKNKWKFNKQLKKWAKAKFLKNILTSKLKRGY